MFLLVSLSKPKFFIRVALVSFVYHSCRTCVVSVALVSHLCRTRVARVSLVSPSCCIRIALVSLVPGTRVVNQTRSFCRTILLFLFNLTPASKQFCYCQWCCCAFHSITFVLHLLSRLSFMLASLAIFIIHAGSFFKLTT